MGQYLFEINFKKAPSAQDKLRNVHVSLRDIAARLSMLSKEMQPGFETFAIQLKRSADVVMLSSEDLQRAEKCFVAICNNYRNAEKLAFEKMNEVNAGTNYGGIVDVPAGGGGSGGAVLPPASGGGYASENPGYGGGVPVTGEGGANLGSGSGDVHGDDKAAFAGGGGSGAVHGDDKASIGGGIGAVYGDDRAGFGGGIGSGGMFGDAGYGDARSGLFPPGFNFWEASRYERIEWWNSLPAPMRLLAISPFVMAFSAATGKPLAAVWDFIFERFGKKIDGNDIKDGKDEDNLAEDSEKDYITEGSEGAGYDNTGSNFNVNANVGGGEFFQNTGGFDNAASQVAAAPGGGAASAAIDKSNSYTVTQKDLADFDVKDIFGDDFGVKYGDYKEPSLPTDYGSQNVSGYASESTATNDDNAKLAASMESFQEKVTGRGLAAPMLGAGVLGAIGTTAAMGAAGKFGAGSGAAAEAGATAEPQAPPVIGAKESRGYFAGDLSGKFVLLGTTMTIAFSGAILSARVGERNRAKKPDDKFRIGYGVSAIHKLSERKVS